MTRATDWDAQVWGDASVLFKARAGTASERRSLGRDLNEALRAQKPSWVIDWIHAFESVLLLVDPCQVDPSDIVDPTLHLLDMHQRDHKEQAQAVFELPVLFDAHSGPDLPGVAAELGRDEDDLVAMLTKSDLEVGCVGVNMIPLLSIPGNLGSVRRMPSPRARVPAGSLALAGANAVVCSVEGPTGWRIVGRTPVSLFAVNRDPMCPYVAGDRMRVRAISQTEWDDLHGRLISRIGGGS